MSDPVTDAERVAHDAWVDLSMRGDYEKVYVIGGSDPLPTPKARKVYVDGWRNGVWEPNGY